MVDNCKMILTKKASPLKRRLKFLFFVFYLIPIRFERLLVFVVAEVVINAVFYRVGQVLLRCVVVRIAVRVQIMLPLVLVVLAVVVLVLKLTRNGACSAAADIG